MDKLVSECQHKLANFRLRELRDVLSRLGLAKQGRKQVLLERIMAMLSDDKGSKSHRWANKHLIGKEEVAKIIDDIYRKMNRHEAPELASKNQNGPSLNVIKEPVIPAPKTCCPCGNSMENESMIQCDDPKCGVRQHMGCVVIPENLVEGSQPERPTQFFCDICRVNRADPFWVTEGQPVLPTKLVILPTEQDGYNNPLQTVEKTFTLTRAIKDLFQKTDYELQVWCILLNDKVPFRMHWPQSADLRVNGISIKVINRQSNQLLGANSRDDGPLIQACSREGANRIILRAYDSRPFVVGVRIIRHQSVQQVLNRIPIESQGEPFEEALARVCRCVGGGASLENGNDSDSDLEVVAESNIVNLRCPMSGSRIKIAGRFKPCVHMGCFDLESFVELNQRARKWQCPICLKNYSLENVIIDPYFNRITSFMERYTEDVTEVEVKVDGSWRPKLEGKAGLFENWHMPDGSIATANVGVSQQQELPIKVKREVEGISGGPTSLKIGIKRNRDGCWEVSGAKDILSSGMNNLSGKHGKQNLKVVPASSSATATNRDDEDPSVNQEGSDNPDFSVNNDAVFDSPLVGLNHTSDMAIGHVISERPKDPEVIVVVSDSEEDNVVDMGPPLACSDPFGQGPLLPFSSDSLHDTSRLDCSGNPLILPNSFLGSFPEGLPPQNNISSSPVFLGASGDFSELPSWNDWLTPPPNPQFRLFGANADVLHGATNSHCTSVIRPTPVTRYGSYDMGTGEQLENSTLESTIPAYGQSLDCPFPSINRERSGDLDNSLEGQTSVFFPHQPARASTQDDHRDSVMMGGDDHWISLSLGVGNNSDKPNEGPAPTICDRQQSAPEGDRLDSLATANILLNISDNRTEAASGDNQGSEIPFSYCQRPRSIRPRRSRHPLTVDADSD
uniref:TSA: Wollemia nobilis Ref_Wollemi_Transcript_13454_3911 transcribed RNA sequence n=1 Tax=Wollemia nobilis TaxID=56998 RepID=A0A0C9S7J0_9CONI